MGPAPLGILCLALGKHSQGWVLLALFTISDDQTATRGSPGVMHLEVSVFLVVVASMGS